MQVAIITIKSDLNMVLHTLQKSLLIFLATLFSLQLLEAKKPVPLRDFEIRLDEHERWDVKDNMRYSKETGYPLAIYDVNFKTSEGLPEEKALEYIRANRELLGLRKGEIENLKLHFIRVSDAGTTVRLRQHYKGLPVGRSEITVNMDKNDVIKVVFSGFRQNIDLPTINPLITKEYATQIALQKIRQRGNVRFLKTNLMVYWNKAFSKLCYEVRVVGDEPHGDWQILVDALTGDFVKVADIAHYHKPKEEHNHSHSSTTSASAMATGTGSVFDADPLSSAGVAYGGNYVDNNDATNASLQAEVFSYNLLDITFTGTEYQLNGPYAVITEWEPPTKGLFSQASSNFNFNREDDGFEATNTYYHIDYSMRYLNVTLGCNIMPRQYSGGVQYDPHGEGGADNSHFNSGTGEIVFGEGCVDDAEDSDVIHHELGHGLHDWVTNGGLSQVEGLSEGCGDYWAGSYNRGLGQWTPADPQYYYMFNWDGHNECWPGRLLNVTGYPGALGGGVHADGQLWASCLMSMWDAVGQQDLDKAFWEGLGMTNATANQNDAAVAVYNAAINMGYSSSDIIAMHSGFTACGYTMPPLPIVDVSFVSSGSSVSEGDGCGSQVVQAMVSMGAEPNATTTVNFSVTNSGSSTVSSSPLTFTTANWNVDQAISITIPADGEVDGDETVTLTLTSVTGSDAVLGSTTSYTLTILDDDMAPSSTPFNTTVFSDDFNSGLAKWNIIDGGNTTDTWSEYSANTLDGTTCLFIDSDPPGSGSTVYETAESIAFNTEGMTNLTLSFDQYFREYNTGYNEMTSVDVWDGSAWQNIYIRDGNSNNQGTIGDWNAPDNQSIDITAYANAAMKVRFIFDAQWDYSWAIDNVTITGDMVTGVQSLDNSANFASEWLGPNQTVHFYDPASGNIMCKIENTSNHDYGCTDVYVDNDGSSFMQVAGYAAPEEQFFDKTFKVDVTNDNPTGSYIITFYISAAERAGWISAGVREWNNVLIVKTDGAITAMTNTTPFEQELDMVGTFGTDYTISASFASGFSGFGFAEELVPLPVELTDIVADVANNDIIVKWTTATEIDNEGFEVMRSASLDKDFEKIGWVAGKGNSSVPVSYLFTDDGVLPGITYYYRLKQMDFDGHFEYSDIVNAKVDSKEISMNLSPNPTSSLLNVVLQNANSTKVSYRVTDVVGKTIINCEDEAVYGGFHFDTSPMSSGVYILRLEIDGKVLTQKFMVD